MIKYQDIINRLYKDLSRYTQYTERTEVKRLKKELSNLAYAFGVTPEALLNEAETSPVSKPHHPRVRSIVRAINYFNKAPRLLKETEDKDDNYQE